MINLMDYSCEELQEYMISLGQPRWRGRQVFEKLLLGVTSFDELTNIPKDLRETLGNNSYLGIPQIVEKFESAIDGTVKYLFKLADGNIIESVVMEYKHGRTICISTQIGCKMGCTFCASAKLGFIRNLSAGEMLGQVIAANKDMGIRISNVVLMGIGEPLDNYENVIKFLKLANDENGLNIGGRHFSLSTSGIVPRIYDLMEEGLGLTLSVSLHASNDEERSKLMPVNNKYSIDNLLEACKIYSRTTKRRITFEYALIAEENDSVKDAEALGKLLKGILCHVNLIPVNHVSGILYRKSGKEAIKKFVSVLAKYKIEATVRREMGSDINAACGQLKRQYDKAVGAPSKEDNDIARLSEIENV